MKLILIIALALSGAAHGQSSTFGAPANDFWRDTATGAKPNNTNDTTQTIRRLGGVGIGGAALTDAVQDVTTPVATNAPLNLSQNAGGRGQIMFGAQPLSFYTERTLPVVVNDYVNIGTFSGSTGAHNLRIAISVGDDAHVISKQYLYPAVWNNTGGAWRALTPAVDSGVWVGTQNFELLVNQSQATLQLRVRRILGTTAGTLRIRIEAIGDPASSLAEVATTGTDATAYAALTYLATPNNWALEGNAGTAPSAYVDTATAQTGNFVGTTDNQNLVMYTNAGSTAQAKSSAVLHTTTAVGNAVAAPTDILTIRRNGVTGVANPAVATWQLGKHTAGATANTRLDLRLSNGATTAADTTVMTALSNGMVGIGTTAPLGKLSVLGNAIIGSNQTAADIPNHVAGNVLNAVSPTQLATNAIAAPETVFRMIRLGTTGPKFGASAEFQIGTNALTNLAATEFRLRLGSGGSNTPNTNVMTWQDNGRVIIHAAPAYATTALAIADAGLLAGTVYTVLVGGARQMFIK